MAGKVGQLFKAHRNKKGSERIVIKKESKWGTKTKRMDSEKQMTQFYSIAILLLFYDLVCVAKCSVSIASSPGFTFSCSCLFSQYK